MKLQKSKVTPIDLKIIHKLIRFIFSSLEVTELKDPLCFVCIDQSRFMNLKRHFKNHELQGIMYFINCLQIEEFERNFQIDS